MHTNHAVVFGHTQIKVKEPEDSNMCCLCSPLAVLLYFICFMLLATSWHLSCECLGSHWVSCGLCNKWADRKSKLRILYL